MRCFSLICVFFSSALMALGGAAQRPFILVNVSDREAILTRIETSAWARQIYDELLNGLSESVDSHVQNPDIFLSRLPFDWSQAKGGEYPPFYQTINYVGDVRENLDTISDEAWQNAETLIQYLETALDCGVAYFLTEDEKYAQCAADILCNFVNGVRQLEVSEWKHRGGLLFPDDGFREVRVIGDKLPLIYDFIASFIKADATVYDYVKKESVAASIDEIQDVIRRYADIVINRGQSDSNHPVLEAPCLVYSALAMEDPSERKELLSYFLEKNTGHQDPLPIMASNYANRGDIWPETSQYLNHVAIILTRLMLVVDRYDPSLRLGARYANILHALPALDYLIYPNGELIRWGDGHRRGHAPYESYEDAYILAEMNGLDTVQEEMRALINASFEKGYKRKGIHALFWYKEDFSESSNPVSLPRTDRVPHAGIYLQRNLSTTGNPQDGLMCFVGGAHMVHGHAEGMNIELFGEGQVLGVDNGRGSYQKDIHENYSRIFAAHNTVIVNGRSQGEGGWVNLGINKVELIAMEPAVGQPGVSPYHSFTMTSFVDDRGEGAEAKQERTLALIRTSPTTGYYVDVFRSNSKLPNEFHDYLYHNIADELVIDNRDMEFKPTPDRYMANANGVWKRNQQYRNPGWHFFGDVQTSKAYGKSVMGRFEIRQLGEQDLFMNLHIPGISMREYSRVDAPHTFEAPAPYNRKPTPTLLIRHQGPAWDEPFVVVYEPYNEKEGSSVVSVDLLSQDGIYKGLKIVSEIDGESMIQYVLTQPMGDTFVSKELGIEFEGSFAVVTTDSTGQLNDVYIGEGRKLNYQEQRISANENGAGYFEF